MFIILWVLRFLLKIIFSPCEASNCLTHAMSLGKDSVLSHIRCWLRPDFSLIDVFGNRFKNRAYFKNFDDSCCFATRSILHVVLRFATMLKRPNDEALIYHTLMFGWVVLPFSDVFGGWILTTFVSKSTVLVSFFRLLLEAKSRHLICFLMSFLWELF